LIFTFALKDTFSLSICSTSRSMDDWQWRRASRNHFRRARPTQSFSKRRPFLVYARCQWTM